MVARLIPSKRSHPDERAPSPVRASPTEQVGQARSAFLRALLDYFDSHQSVRYPTEVNIPVASCWSSLPTFEAELQDLLTSAAEGLPSILQFLVRHSTKDLVTVFPRSRIRNLASYMIASDLSYDLREFLAGEKGAKTLAGGYRKQIRDVEAGTCYTPGWTLWNADDGQDVMIALECPRGIQRTAAQARLKAAVQSGAAKIAILCEVEIGLTPTKADDGTTTNRVTSSALIIRIFALSTKRTITEYYNSGVVEYWPDQPDAPTHPPDLVLPLGPFLQDSVDRGRKGLMLSIGGDSVTAWVREVYHEAVAEWKKGTS